MYRVWLDGEEIPGMFGSFDEGVKGIGSVVRRNFTDLFWKNISATSLSAAVLN